MCASSAHGEIQKLITSGVIETTSQGSQSSSLIYRRRISSSTRTVRARELAATKI
jgi:hypothetical protein